MTQVSSSTGDNGSGGAHEFYQSRQVVEQYETGRSDRIFVADLPRLLAVGRHYGFAEQLPLYAIFDWIYGDRLRRISDDVLHGRILDLGCGTSYFYRALITGGWRGTVCGIDVSPAMITEGSRRLRHLRAWKAPRTSADRGQYRFRDALGRTALGVVPPLDLVNADSVDHLLQNRTVGDAERLPPDVYATVTSFSGPFCFYQRDRQRSMVLQACDRASHAVSLQFKNAGFHAMNKSGTAVAAIAAIADHVLRNTIEDSYAYLRSIGFRPPAITAVDGDSEIPHEVGGFAYYTTTLDDVLCWFAEAGFVPIRIGTMGFSSQTFYELITPHYAAFAGDPGRLAAFVRSVVGIDEYFCSDLLLGDNLQITAVRRVVADMPAVTYRPTGTYRHGYRVERREPQSER